MSRTPLRLVVDLGGDLPQSFVELDPPNDGALHIHLHVGPQPATASTVPLANHDADPKGRSGRRWRKPLAMGTAAVLVTVLAFDFGARTGAGHAQALAAARASAAGLASLAAQPPAPDSASQLPVAVQQQLAQRPTVTQPPGGAPSAGADPFGLQH